MLSEEAGHLKSFFLLKWCSKCPRGEHLAALLQITAGGGGKMEGLKGYCCVCNLTSNPDLKAIFAEVIYEPMWHGVAAGTKVILQLLACFILWL